MTIAHKLDGSGPPLLLLNGGLMTIASWEPVATRLATAHTVVRCDFRGQLLSPGVPEPSFSAHAADVATLIEELHAAPVHVAGTSFGGIVAMLLSATRPDLVASLAVITAGAHATAKFDEDARMLDEAAKGALSGGSKRLILDLIHASAFSEAFLEANPGFAEALASRADFLPDSWFEGSVGLTGALQGYDLRADLPRIAVPTLVVEASEDRVFPAPAGEAIANLIPGAKRIVVEGGHALVVEKPIEVADAIAAHVASVARPSQHGPS